MKPRLDPSLSNADYHADPALSASGMKRLLEAPARYVWEREHPVFKDMYDFGSAAHRMVLEDDTVELAVIDAPDWRSATAREERDAARAEGKIPVLAATYKRVEAMAAKLREHPIASRLLRPGSGIVEASAFWTHTSGVNLRARFDYLPKPGKGRMIVPDYKTTTNANPHKWVKNAGDYGYHIQADQYLSAVEALDYADDAAFVFVLQEKDPPYLVSVAQFPLADMQLARAQRERAIRIFDACTHTGVWPGYPDEVALVSLPPYYRIPQEEALES